MKVTDVQISELKSKYGELYKVTRRDTDYILRFPTLKEWKEAISKKDSFATNEKIVRTCLVHPSLAELTSLSKSDASLETLLAIRLRSEIVRDDDADEGVKYESEEGISLFKISRKGKTYVFRYPARHEWKRISSLISTDNGAAIEYLVAQCILDVSEKELAEIEEKDVDFINQIGSPFLMDIVKDWADSEGKRI